MALSRLGKAILGLFATLLGFVLLIAVGIGYGLGTPSGRVWLAESGLPFAAGQAGYQLQIDAVRSDTLGHWSFGRIELTRDGQSLFTGKQLRIEWVPADLRDKRLAIHSLSAERIELYVPENPADADEPDPTKSRRTSLAPFPLTLDRLRIAELRLHHPSLPADQRYAVNARLALQPHGVPVSLDLDVRTLSGVPLTASIQTELQNAQQAILRGSLHEAAGGLIGGRIRQHPDQAVHAEFSIAIREQDGQYHIDVDRLSSHYWQHPLSVQGQASYQPESQAQAWDLTVQTGAQTHHLRGQTVAQRLDMDVTLDALPLDLASPWLDQAISGSLDANLTVTGPLNDPRVNGQLDLVSRYRNLPWRIQAVGSGSKSRLSFEKLDVVSGDSHASGQGEVDLGQQTADAIIDADALPLSLLRQLGLSVPEELDGQLAGRIQTQGPWQSPEVSGSARYQGQYRGVPLQVSVLGRGSTTQLTFERLEVVSNDTQVSASGAVDLTRRTSDLQLASDALPLSLLRQLGLPVPPHLDGQLATHAQIRGPWAMPTVDGNARFDGQYQNLPLKLFAQGSGNAQRFELQQLTLETEQQGVLRASGLYAPEALDLTLHAQAVPTEIASGLGWKVQPGKFNADLAVKGSLRRPLIEGRMHLTSEFVTQTPDDEQLVIPLDLRATAATADEQLSLRAVIRERGETLGHLDVDLPLYAYLNLQPGQTIPLKGAVSADLDLAYLRLLLDPEEHKIGGRLSADLTLDGDLDSPRVDGEASFTDVHYENVLSGTVLTQGTASLTFNQHRLNIVEAHANDGGSGTLTLGGHADWSDGTDQAVTFNLVARDANLLRRHDLEGVANGELSLTGSLRDMLLAGTLDVTPFTLYLDNLQHRGIPTLKVTEIDAATASAAESRPGGPLMPVVRMNVTLQAGQQAFLRGKGLVAELQGRVQAKGTLNRSRYSGNFKTLRGQYEILGKKFILQDGWVRFEGDHVILFIPGLHRARDVDIRAELSGTLDDLKLVLSSNPVMPQDEIISHLLFGKSAQNISPLQAIRLANAVNNLRTGGSGLFDPVEATRNLLGVDTISVDTEETENGNGVTVGVGKYVSEKVYIELESGSNPTQPWKGSVEVEVSPKLSVESTTGGDSGLGGIELQWKHDY